MPICTVLITISEVRRPGRVEDLVFRRQPVPPHVAGDLVHRVVPADVLHIDQRPVLARQHAAVDGARFQIEAGGRVDLAGQRRQPGCLDPRGRGQPDILELLHQVAENRPLGTARGQRLLLQLLFVIGRALGADNHRFDLVVIDDIGHAVVGAQHVLIEQIAERQIFRVIADRHHGDDLLTVEEQGQGAFDRDRGFYRRSGLVDARDPLRQARVGGIGADDELFHGMKPIRPHPVRQAFRDAGPASDQIISNRKWLARPITDAATMAIAVYRSPTDHRAQSLTKLSILTPLMLPTLCSAMTTPKKLRCLWIRYLKFISWSAHPKHFQSFCFDLMPRRNIVRPAEIRQDQG